MRSLLVVLILLLMASPVNAEITYKETGRIVQPWGIDVTIQFLDGETVLQTSTMRFVNEKEINHDLDNRCQRKITQIEYDIANPPPEPLDRNTIEEVLREKGYLEEGESFEDLPVNPAEEVP